MTGWTFTKRMTAGSVLCAFLAASAACYGPFNLTKNVYHWNGGIKGSGQVNDKWMRELVFFGMIVVPVYMFSALLDAFVFNSIQFWTGDNPVKATGLGREDSTTKVAHLGDVTLRWTVTGDGATVAYERQGLVERRATILSVPWGYRLVDEDGETMAEAKIEKDGAVTWLNKECQIVQQWTAERIARLGS